MTIPDADSILADSFAKHVEFPFTFGDIVSIEIPRRIGTGEFECANDLATIHSAIVPNQDLVVSCTIDRITITGVVGNISKGN